MQLLKHFFPRMPISIAHPAGDDCPLWRDPCKKIGLSCTDTPVMAYLQQRALEARLTHHRPFDWRLRIPFQQCRGGSVRNVKHQRVVVVRGISGLLVVELRQHVDRRIAQLKCFPSAQFTPMNV